MELYREEDFNATKRMTLLRFAVLAVILAATIALLVLFLNVWRNEIAATLVCVLGASAMYFYLSMKILPWVHYWHYQADMRRGRTHEMDCRFVSFSDAERISDGVAFHDFIVTLEGDDQPQTEEEEADRQRLLLWDADKPMPALQPGQRLHVRSFGSYIIALDAD